MNFEILRASGPLGHIELITHLAGVQTFPPKKPPANISEGRNAYKQRLENTLDYFF
jgi:hypothetical protein